MHIHNYYSQCMLDISHTTYYVHTHSRGLAVCYINLAVCACMCVPVCVPVCVRMARDCSVHNCAFKCD